MFEPFRRRSKLAIVCAIAILMSLPAMNVSAQNRALKIGLATAGVAHMLLYIADSEGMFKAEGLDVQLVLFASDAASAQGLTAGAVQVNSGSISSVLNSHATGRDLTTFWCITNMPGYVWYGKPEFKSIKDLKGKGRMGVSSIASQTHRLSAWALRSAGLDPEKDVQFLGVGGPLQRVAALKAGQVDVIPATPPGTYILERDGFKPILVLQDIMPEFVYETFYARKATIEKDESAIRSMIRATIKAKQWAEKNRDGATAILMKKLGADASERAIYRRTVDHALPFYPDDGHFAEKSIDVFLEFYRDEGRIKTLPKHSAFTDYRFLDHFKANPVR